MHWVWPNQVLLTAAVLGPLLGVLGWQAARRRRQALAQWLGVGAESWLRAALPTRRGRALALLGTWALVLVALARPQGGTVRVESDLGGAVVLALDGSASMRATDASPSRLALATQWAAALAAQLPGCRLGLIVFAGEAQVLCPPTEDHAIFRDLLADVPAATPAREGSELGPALELGGRVLERAGGGVLVVATDGEYHDRDPGAGLNQRRRGGFDLLTLTVGGSIPVPVPGRAPGEVVTDPRDGRTALTAARPEAMRALARSAGGLALEAASSEAGMAEAVRFIEARLAARTAPAVTVQREERFQWPLGLALLLLILRLALPEGSRSRSASGTVRSLGARLAVLWVVCLAARAVADPGAAADPARLAGLRAASLQAPGHDLPRCLYNLALALHESGQVDEAQRTYLRALALPGGAQDVRARCLNNLGALAIGEAQERGAHQPSVALAALARAQAALREALRLEPRLEVASRNLLEALGLAEIMQARLAALRPDSADRASVAGALPPPPPAAEQAPLPPPVALPAAGALSTARDAARQGVPVQDGGALERLCQEAGSAREFRQILTRGRTPERPNPTLPW